MNQLDNPGFKHEWIEARTYQQKSYYLRQVREGINPDEGPYWNIVDVTFHKNEADNWDLKCFKLDPAIDESAPDYERLKFAEEIKRFVDEKLKELNN